MQVIKNLATSSSRLNYFSSRIAIFFISKGKDRNTITTGSCKVHTAPASSCSSPASMAALCQNPARLQHTPSSCQHVPTGARCTLAGLIATGMHQTRCGCTPKLVPVKSTAELRAVGSTRGDRKYATLIIQWCASTSHPQPGQRA